MSKSIYHFPLQLPSISSQQVTLLIYVIYFIYSTLSPISIVYISHPLEPRNQQVSGHIHILKSVLPSPKQPSTKNRSSVKRGIGCQNVVYLVLCRYYVGGVQRQTVL